jgi:hypothetical protein
MAKKNKKTEEQELQDGVLESKTVTKIERYFNDVQLAEFRDSLVKLLTEKGTVQDEKKIVTMDHNKRLKEIEKEINETCIKIQTGKETIEAECKVVYDFAEMKKYVKHPDTGETIETLDIDIEDLSMREELEKKAKKNAERKAKYQKQAKDAKKGKKQGRIGFVKPLAIGSGKNQPTVIDVED